MMTAHVVIKAYNEEHPSTLDGRALSLLRRQYRYPGVIISDDLEMAAIADRYSMSEAIEPACTPGSISSSCADGGIELREHRGGHQARRAAQNRCARRRRRTSRRGDDQALRRNPLHARIFATPSASSKRSRSRPTSPRLQAVMTRQRPPSGCDTRNRFW